MHVAARYASRLADLLPRVSDLFRVDVRRTFVAITRECSECYTTIVRPRVVLGDAP